jgi:HrpA-like RNA helicase
MSKPATRTLDKSWSLAPRGKNVSSNKYGYLANDSSDDESTDDESSDKSSDKSLEESKEDSHMPSHVAKQPDISHLKGMKIYPYLVTIHEHVMANNVTVINGKTGSGKTAGYSQYFLTHDKTTRYLIITSPTIMNAMLHYQYACKMNPEISNLIAYAANCQRSVSFEKAKIVYMTTQTAINHLKHLYRTDKKMLDNIVLMADEMHHPLMENYIVLGIVNWLLKNGADIRVIVASATLTPHKFDQLNAGKVFTVDGTHFPVKIEWANSSLISANSGKFLKDQIMRRIYEIVTNLLKTTQTGDVLVFVTGEDDVEQLCGQFENSFPNVNFVPCYSALDQSYDSDRFSKDETKRKVIIATNIAETGVTFDGIEYVIDSGLHKKKRMEKGTSILEETLISRASSTQRAGRAGRTRVGTCFRMCTEDEWSKLPEFIENEFFSAPKHLSIIALMSSGLPAKDILNIDDQVFGDLMGELQTMKMVEDNKVTKLGTDVSKYPLSIPSAVTLINSLSSLSDGFSKLTGENACRAIYMIMATVLIDTKISSPYIFNVPRTERDDKTNFIATRCGDFFGYDDIETLMTIFMDMLIANTDPNTNHLKNYNKWCSTNHINKKFLDMATKLFKQVCKTVLGTVNISVSQYKYIETNRQNYKDMLVKCITTGYTNNVYVLRNSMYKTYSNKSNPYVEYKSDRNSFSTMWNTGFGRPPPQQILCLATTQIKVERGYLNIMNLCIKI